LGATPGEHFSVSATYRFTHYVTEADRGGYGYGYGAASDQLTYSQQEAYGSASAFGDLFGASAHYGYVQGGSDVLGTAHVLGITLRASPLGDVILEGSAALYEDGTVWRVAPAWALPIVDHVTLIPSGAVQRFAGEFSFSAGGGVQLTLGDLRITAGARVGREVRPTYLSIPVSYNTTDEIRAGITTSVQWTATPQIALYVSHEWERLDTLANTGTQAADAHFAALGIGASL
jgi:hypothetical protein